MNQIWNSKVSDSLNVKLEGINRTFGNVIVRTVGELLEEAEAKEGVYGNSNKDVGGEMTVRELADWHADYNWMIAE